LKIVSAGSDMVSFVISFVITTTLTTTKNCPFVPGQSAQLRAGHLGHAWVALLMRIKCFWGEMHSAEMITNSSTNIANMILPQKAFTCFNACKLCLVIVSLCDFTFHHKANSLPCVGEVSMLWRHAPLVVWCLLQHQSWAPHLEDSLFEQHFEWSSAGTERCVKTPVPNWTWMTHWWIPTNQKVTQSTFFISFHDCFVCSINFSLCPPLWCLWRVGLNKKQTCSCDFLQIWTTSSHKHLNQCPDTCDRSLAL